MIGKLIENGDLGWDTTIADVLGEMPMQAEYRNATITQLMSHEAGIQPYTNFDRATVEEIIESLRATTTNRLRTKLRTVYSIWEQQDKRLIMTATKISLSTILNRSLSIKARLRETWSFNVIIQILENSKSF